MDRKSGSSSPSLLRMYPIIREIFVRNYDYIAAKSFAYCEIICTVLGPGVLRIMLSAAAFNVTESIILRTPGPNTVQIISQYANDLAAI